MSCLRGDPQIDIGVAALAVFIAVCAAMLAMHLFG